MLVNPEKIRIWNKIRNFESEGDFLGGGGGGRDGQGDLVKRGDFFLRCLLHILSHGNSLLMNLIGKEWQT